MLASPDQQISLTDPDSRSMATSGRGSGVFGYNVQIAVDTKHHLIVAHEVTNKRPPVELFLAKTHSGSRPYPGSCLICFDVVEIETRPGQTLADERVERRLAAVLAADVAGYSRLMGTDEEGTLSRLKAIRKELVDPTLAKHRGRIVKTTGDGLLVEFASAVDAVRGAVEVQRGIAERIASVPHGLRIEFRIGIHVGDIIIDDNDIFGDGVNVAARLEGIAEPGGICMSNDAYRQVRGKVDIVCDDMGPQQLKNISEPMQAWRIGLIGQTASPSRSTSIASEPQPLPLPEKPSIAVLPFQNISGDPEQEYFADGIVEDIITALSRFKSLFVIARNSSFTYKGKAVDIKQVGRELGVKYVLEGSVRKVGQKVRITGQLIEAVTGAHLWADKFDGDLSDVFQLQDTVTTSIVGSIDPTLSEAEFENAGRKPVENWNSYDYYLRGQKLFNEGNSTRPGATREALELYRRAVDLDPAFGRAYAMFALCVQTIRDLHGQPISDQERLEALELGEKAIQLAGDDATVLANLVFVFGMLSGDYIRAAELARRALALNSNLAKAWNASGVMDLILGNPENALGSFEKAMRLNPIDKVATPFSLFGLAAAHFALGNYDRGSEFARKVLILRPNDIRGLFTLLANDCHASRLSEAEATAAQIRERFPHLRASHLRQAYFVKPASTMAQIEHAIAFIGLPD